MEKEQKKLSTGVVVLIITLVVALVTVSTILAYKILNEEETNKPLTEVNNEQKEVEENKTEDKEENKVDEKEEIKEENTEKEEKNENKNQEAAEVVESKDVNIKGRIESFGFIELNSKEIKLEVKVDEKEGEYGYTEEYTVKIDGKEVKGIEKQSNQYYSLLANNYRISSFPDQKNGKEYIALTIIGGGDSYSTAEVYIIDEKANLIARVEKAHSGITFGFKEERHEEINWYVNSSQGYIIDIQLGGTDEERVKKHKYTIENGKLKNEIVGVYSVEETTAAGKLGW